MSWNKEMPKEAVVAVAGVTGAVGSEFLEVLHDLNFPMSELKLLASARSSGKTLYFKGAGKVEAGEYEVEEMIPESFEGVNIALFSAGSEISEKFREVVVSTGAVMIDNSSAFRMCDDVPLIVPEVNPEDISWHSGVIANPNCSTIQMMVAVAPLNKLSKIKRIVTSTYQATSGAGAPAMQELYEQSRAYLDGKRGEELVVENFQHQIAFNCIPHIDVFADEDYTKEEWKMVNETKKILHDPDIRVCATCVRVPVLRCHAESINLEFVEDFSVQAAREVIEAAPGLVLMDDIDNNTYPMPGLLAHTNDTYIGRLRKDISCDKGLVFWCVTDQIRKCAVLNAVQIAELLVK
ncbi:MAG: aspartate-semialdehyde dehydrogenase [Eggerthellaceae bacterium]|nr:aspartate-semialdehyde dehydrogenase [Eggerthellaceae bacterium]